MQRIPRGPTISALELVIAGMVAGASPAFAIELGELKRDGPWVFTERIEGSELPHKHMAATPAAEDGDVWLLLACDTVRVTASLMFSTVPHYIVRSPVHLVLRSDGFPIVSIAAQIVHKTQLSIDPESTRHLMPLFIESGRIVISMRDEGGATHDYTFSLQPNTRVLAELERFCGAVGHPE
jgi:hypothetical protein